MTVLFQVGNATYWPDFKPCILNVKRAMEAEGHGFHVFLSFHSDIDHTTMNELETDAQSTFGSDKVMSIMVENRGADIGPYLRQLQVLGQERVEQHYDIYLKIHTKGNDEQRRGWLTNICGDVQVIRRLYTRFGNSPSVGMIAPPGTMWAPSWARLPKGASFRRGPSSGAWKVEEVAAMNRTWDIMFSKEGAPLKKGTLDSARMIAGSFFWARRDAVLYDVILRSVDRLVEAMPYRYSERCCGTAHALERLLPTMAATIRGFSILSLASVVPGCCPHVVKCC